MRRIARNKKEESVCGYREEGICRPRMVPTRIGTVDVPGDSRAKILLKIRDSEPPERVRRNCGETKASLLGVGFTRHSHLRFKYSESSSLV